MSLSEHVVYDYIHWHPAPFFREKLTQTNVIPIDEFKHTDDGDIVKVAGLVLVRQRPGTAGGICFMTIEDETGNANLVVFRNLFENVYRKEILQSKLNNGGRQTSKRRKCYSCDRSALRKLVTVITRFNYQ